MSQTIRTSIGAVEYTLPLTITETTGKDITADVIRLALGTQDDPDLTTIYTPDIDSSPRPSQRVVQLLIGTTVSPVAGRYHLWWKLTDAPEIIWRRGDSIIIA